MVGVMIVVGVVVAAADVDDCRMLFIFTGRQRKVDRRGWRCGGVGDRCRDRAFAVAVGDGHADLGFLWELWAVLAPVAVGVHDVGFVSKVDLFGGVAHDSV